MNQLLATCAFVRVVDSGSFSRAADQLALPRSTVSKLVGDLESHLGVRLMHRTTRSIATTAEGLAYHVHAVGLIDEVDAVDCVIRAGAIDDSAMIGRQLLALEYVTCAAPPEVSTRLPNLTACE